MIRPLLYSILIVALCAITVRADQDSAQTTDPTVVGLVKVAAAIKVPAKEAGVLLQLAVQEGVSIRAGQVIGKIDDSEPQMQKQAALSAYNGAYNRWKDDVEVRFSQAQAEVDHADWLQMIEANKGAEKSIPETEVRGQKLKWDRSILAIEKANHDRNIASWEAKEKNAALEAAELAIQRRIVKAPFDGVVEEIKRHQDEWVQPGDSILTLLPMDTMHVEGEVDQSKYDPHEIQGCEVTVEVEMARGRKATFRGRIIKVSSLVRSDGVYDVRAEIANKQEQGNWLLRDGLTASMRIHLGTGSPAPAVSRAR